MRALFATLVILLSFAASALAQTPTSITLKVYQGTTIKSTLPVPIAQWQCGQPKQSGSNVDPTRWVIDDPADRQNKDCIYVDSRFADLAAGNYTGTTQAVYASGSSAETAPVPFTKSPPPVPTGLRIIN